MAPTLLQPRHAFSTLAIISLGVLLGSNPAKAELLATEAGFSDVERIGFSFQREGPTLNFTSSRAEVFYSFQLADQTPATKPLFVFFNGGPGCPTCEGLLSSNTARNSIYPTPWGPTGWLDSSSPNPDSWTRIGNLLYIDAPTTGFSYNIAEVPKGRSNAHLYDAQNYNPYIDAAQMVRVLLRFLRAHPTIRNNPVVLVGESYGGTRVSLMLNLLQNYRRYGTGGDVYVDKELAREVQSFLDLRPGATPGRVYTAADIAQQFGRQILIQPQLTGAYQSDITGALYEKPGSVIYALAADKDKTFTPCASGCNPAEHAIRFVVNDLDLSPYDTRRPIVGKNLIDNLRSEAFLTAWMWIHFAFVGPPSEVLEFDLTAIDQLYVNKRGGVDPSTGAAWYAYDRKYPQDPWSTTPNLAGIPPTARPWFEVLPQVNALGQALLADQGIAGAAWGSPLMTVFGVPADTNKDAIYNSCPPMDAYNAFYSNSATRSAEHPERYDISPESPRYGRLFIENLPQVKTMITDARRDLIIYSPALAPSLERYSELVKTAVARHGCTDAKCDGTIEVEYQPTAVTKLRKVFPGHQTIWFPHYEDSGHSVAAGMPDKFLNDVAAWMAGSKP